MLFVMILNLFLFHQGLDLVEVKGKFNSFTLYVTFKMIDGLFGTCCVAASLTWIW